MSLFPVIEEENNKDKPIVSNAWLTIGSSFDENIRKKKESKPETTQNAQGQPSDDKNYFDIKNRITSRDLLQMDSSDESEEEVKKKKKHKKKKKDKKKVTYDPNLDDLEQTIEDEAYQHLDTAIELYMPQKNVLSHETEFLYKHIMRKDLLPVSVIKLSEKENYEYGAPQIKDVPLFRRIRRYPYKNMILGLQSDRTTLAIIDELNRVQGINRSLYVENMDDIPAKRYFTSYTRSDEIVDIKREKGLDPNLLKLGFIPLETRPDQMEEEDTEELKLNRDEMSQKEADLLEKTKEYNKKLDENPTDALLWIEFINFQDKHHQGMVGKANYSLLEKKLAILEKAMSNPQLENNPLMILYHLRLLHQASTKSDDFYKVLHSTWQKYLEKNDTNIVFWILFTDFKYSYFTRFSITYMRESFSESLKKIQDRMATSSNTKEIAIFKYLQLYLLKKLCYFEKMSGFFERGVGIFQSLIELNMFLPNSLVGVYDKNLRLNKYQEYYESYEYPRVGELTKYQGWPDSETNLAEMTKEFQENFIGKFEDQIINARPMNDLYHEFVQDICLYLPENFEEGNTRSLAEWLFQEYYSMSFWRPANNSYDKRRIQDSPDSIVLFDDIQNYLILVHQESFKMELINNLLQILGFIFYFNH